MLDGNTITETVDFATDATVSLIGRSFSLQIKVDSDTYAQIDADGVYKETWKRLTPTQASNEASEWR